MRKQLVKSVELILQNNNKSVLLLGDIGVFGFRNSLQKYSSRVYNIGILEQSTIGIAAGLSKSGLIPIVHTIAPFLVERAYEQLKIDFGYQNITGNFISVGASYDYASLGPTHHCPADISSLLNIPNMQIVIPGTSKEFDILINQSYQRSPTYYRLSEFENNIDIDVEFGKGNLIKKGKDATIICYGNMLESVIESTKDLNVTILYYTTIEPFDYELLINNFNKNIIIIEQFYEGTTNYIVNKYLQGYMYRLYNFGIPREFILNYGEKEQHDEKFGIDVIGLKNNIQKCLI